VDRQSNIFYRITRDNENSSTELLCNLLRSKYVRDICLRYFGIPENLLDKIDIHNIHTQKKFDELGIPDIIIKGDDYFYIIENKIRVNTGLTENQEENYIDIINKHSKAHSKYIFLVPEEYGISKLEEKYKSIIIIKTWEELLKRLRKHEIHKESILINEALNYFSTLLNISSCEDIKLTPYEVAMFYNPRDILESMNLLNKVYDMIKKIEDDILKIDKNRFTPGDDRHSLSDNEIGKYFNYDKKESIFIGLNLYLINKKDVYIKKENKNISDYIFSVRFRKGMLKEDDVEKIVDYCSDGDSIYIPLNMKILLEDNNKELLKKEITEKITLFL
jgi:hypothetical protein